MEGLEEKLTYLKELIRQMGSALVAFSGGVDSTFLLKVARDLLDGRALAITALSTTYPRGELEGAKGLDRLIGASQTRGHHLPSDGDNRVRGKWPAPLLFLQEGAFPAFDPRGEKARLRMGPGWN